MRLPINIATCVPWQSDHSSKDLSECEVPVLEGISEERATSARRILFHR
jgi:hypothetical protein